MKRNGGKEKVSLAPNASLNRVHAFALLYRVKMNVYIPPVKPDGYLATSSLSIFQDCRSSSILVSVTVDVANSIDILSPR